jgi:N4-gp56 family major capsid protein
MANSTLTSLNDLIAPIVQEAMFVASERAIMPGLVKNFTVPANAGKVLQVPLYGTNTAITLAEGTDLAGDANGDVTISTGVANITLSEAGIMTLVTDMAINHATSNVIADLGKLFGEAIAKKHDTTLTSLFTNFTEVGAGAQGKEILVENLFQAYATLKSNAVPGPYYGVFHPKAIYNIKKELTNSFVNPYGSNVANQAMTEGYIGRIAGIDIYETSNFADFSDGQVVNAVFSRDAMGLAVSSALKVATQRDESLRGSEVVATTVFGASVLHSTYGVKLLGDTIITN